MTSSAESLQLPARQIQPAAQWHSLPDAPTARLMTAWAVLHGKIWIVGGLHEGVALQTVESYDPNTGAWQTQPPLPIPLHHATAATYRGEVVVLGGSSGDLTQSSNKVFALRGGSWVELPSLTHARAAAAAAVVGDKLVVAGGQNAKQLVPQTEVFDGTAWHDAANIPTPREHLAAVSDGTSSIRSAGECCPATRTPRRWSASTRNPGHGPRWHPCRRRAAASAPPLSMAASWRSAVGTDSGVGGGRDVRHRRRQLDRTAPAADTAPR